MSVLSVGERVSAAGYLSFRNHRRVASETARGKLKRGKGSHRRSYRHAGPGGRQFARRRGGEAPDSCFFPDEEGERVDETLDGNARRMGRLAGK